MATVPLNLILCLLAGLGFACCARTQLVVGAKAWQWHSLEMGLVFSYAVLTVAPVSAYLYVAFPEWSWMYLFDPARLPVGTGLAVITVTLLLVPIGYLLGGLLLKWVGERGLFAALAVLGMLVVLLLVLSSRRVFYVGRIEDFRAGGGGVLMRPLTQGKVFFALLCTTPVLLLAAILIGRSLWGHGRWLRQQASATLRIGESASRPGVRAEQSIPQPGALARADVHTSRSTTG